MQVLGFVDTDQATQRGEKVNDSRRFLLDPSTSNPVFPVENARDAMPTFEERPLFAAQFTASLLQIAAVIGSVDNDGIVELAEFFEFFNEVFKHVICNGAKRLWNVDGKIRCNGLLFLSFFCIPQNFINKQNDD